MMQQFGFLSCSVLSIIICIVFADVHLECHHNIKLEHSCVKKQKHSCTYKEVYRHSVFSMSGKSANEPTFDGVNWHVRRSLRNNKTKNVIVLNATWFHEASTLLTFVEGYFLTIQLSMAALKHFRVYYSNQSCALTQNQDQLVYFSFLYEDDDVVRPGRCFHVAVMSLPSFCKSCNVLQVVRRICIPDCSDRTIRDTSECVSNRKYRRREQRRKRKRKAVKERKQQLSTKQIDYNTPNKTKLKIARNHSNSSNSEFKEIVVIPIGLLFLLVTLAIAFLLVATMKTRKKKNILPKSLKDAKLGKLLILINLKEKYSSYHDAANILSSMLGDHHVFNLWNRSGISDPNDWLFDQVKSCVHVLLFQIPEDEGSVEEESVLYNQAALIKFMTGLHKVKSKSVASLSGTIVSFHSKPFKASLYPPNLKRFQLMEEYKEFMEHIRKKVSLPSVHKDTIALQLKVDDIRKLSPSSICTHSREERLYPAL